MQHRLLLTCLLCLSAFTLFSQTDSSAVTKKKEKEPFYAEPDTSRHGFFSAKRFHSSCYVQAGGDLTYMLSKPGMLTDFGITWTMNHKLTLGARYSILTTKQSVSKLIHVADTLPIYASQMSAVITVGYILRSDKKFSIHPEIGLGWANLTFTDYTHTQTKDFGQKSDKFNFNYFMFNPSVSFLWNATKYFRVGAVLGARACFGTDYYRLKSYRAGGIYGGIFFRAGTF